MKYEIEIEGLPGGMIAHSVKVIELDSGDSEQCTYNAQVIAKRVKPRRIVLEETDEENHRYDTGIYGAQTFQLGMIKVIDSKKKWREVKETAPSLNNADDKESLRLSVDECKEAMRKLETFNVTDLSVKICRFLKDK